MSRSALAELDLWRLFSTMTKISYAGYRFPPEIIQQAIWLYVRFTLSNRATQPVPDARPPPLGESTGADRKSPHGITATHQDQVNADLLAFIKDSRKRCLAAGESWTEKPGAAHRTMNATEQAKLLAI